MKVRFISPASSEMNQAIDYYNHQLPGLGFRFFQEISSSIKLITTFPEGWIKISENTRRSIIKGFPYAIYYALEDEEIIITAIANLHRNPESYKNRMT